MWTSAPTFHTLSTKPTKNVLGHHSPPHRNDIPSPAFVSPPAAVSTAHHEAAAADAEPALPNLKRGAPHSLNWQLSFSDIGHLGMFQRCRPDPVTLATALSMSAFQPNQETPQQSSAARL